MARRVVLEFSGGAELLFNKTKKHEVTLPESEKEWTIGSLLPWMRDTMLQERPELFMQGNTVRPGILVLINDSDWELMDYFSENNTGKIEIHLGPFVKKGELEYPIKDNDRIVFISTLHGG